MTTCPYCINNNLWNILLAATIFYMPITNTHSNVFNHHFEILHTMYQKIKSELLPDSWNLVRKYKLVTTEHVNDENW